MIGKMNVCLLATGLALAAVASPSFGQADAGAAGGNTPPPANNGGGGGPGGPGGQGGGGGGGGGGNFNPQQMRERMMSRLKDQLAPITDEEFQALEPKIAKVMELRMQTGMMGFRGGRRGGGGGGGDGGPGGGGGAGGGAPDGQTSPTQQALNDLRTTLQDTNASADTIKEKLKALRDARAKAKADLTAAQQDLQSVLTERQEAVLVEYGMLD